MIEMNHTLSEEKRSDLRKFGEDYLTQKKSYDESLETMAKACARINDCSVDELQDAIAIARGEKTPSEIQAEKDFEAKLDEAFGVKLDDYSLDERLDIAFGIKQKP